MDDFIDIHLNNKLYFSNSVIKQNYNIYYSDLINDSYWNFAYLKNNQINYNHTFKNILSNMKALLKPPTLYITSNILNENLSKSIAQNSLKLLYTDVWMSLENLDTFIPFKSKLNFKTYKVDKLLKDKFIQAIMIGFSEDSFEDPYKGLSEGYKESLEKTFINNNLDYKIIHYAGIKNQEIISTATVVYKSSSAILYNITTNKNYQKHGVCKQMMFEIINELKSMGINKICVQTEEGFYPELIYKKFGFKEFMLGYAYIMEE